MVVLDSSALLAALYGEPGQETVAAVLGRACMSTVNVSEVLARFVRDGRSIEMVTGLVRPMSIDWVSFSEDHAILAASLLPKTRPFGLSLGDRACLALAISRGIPVITADRAWARLAPDIAIELIR